MKDYCSNFTLLHKNRLGKMSYSSCCQSYHLYLKGLLTVVNHEQLAILEKSLVQMAADIDDDKERIPGVQVQIRITNNTYLCLSTREVLRAVELINVGRYMHQVQSILN